MRLESDSAGSGPTIVLLHGFPLDRSMWKSQADALATRHRVVTPDLRGHGASAAPPGVYSMDDQAADVLETLDALGVTGPFILGGLSMGGYVAMALAAKAPERLSALLLLNTRCKPDSPDAAANREKLASQVESTGDVAPVVNGMLPKLFADDTRDRQPELVTQWERRMLRTPAAGVVGALRGMAIRPDRTDTLRQLDVPTLVLAGAKDVIIPLNEAEEMASVLRRGHFEIIGGAGHLAPVENPDATSSVISRFLGDLT